MDHTIITEGLLSVFLSVLVMASALTVAILRWRKFGSQPLPLPEASVTKPTDETLPELPSFVLRRTNSWLAVRGSKVQAVQAALCLNNAKSCAWSEGLLLEDERRIFVAPPIDGWILVIGPALPDPAEDVDVCFKAFCELSRKLGHIQFFHVDPVSEQHAWGVAEDGRVRRAYAWAGKTLWNQGTVSPAESDLEMQCFGYGEGAETANFGFHKHEIGNADKVHLLASRWSLDVAEVDRRLLERERGIVGELSRN